MAQVPRLTAAGVAPGYSAAAFVLNTGDNLLTSDKLAMAAAVVREAGGAGRRLIGDLNRDTHAESAAWSWLHAPGSDSHRQQIPLQSESKPRPCDHGQSAQPQSCCG